MYVKMKTKKEIFQLLLFVGLFFCCCCYCCFCFCTQLIKTLLGLVMVVALVSSCLNECGPYDDVCWVWVNENCKWTEKTTTKICHIKTFFPTYKVDVMSWSLSLFSLFCGKWVGNGWGCEIFLYVCAKLCQTVWFVRFVGIPQLFNFSHHVVLLPQQVQVS